MLTTINQLGGKRMTRIPLAASVAVLAGIGLGSAGANAQGLLTIQKLSAALANQLVGESVADCAKKNYAVTAVVVDLDGVRQAVLRGTAHQSTRSTTHFTRPTPRPR
jgi:hypothetical protein